MSKSQKSIYQCHTLGEIYSLETDKALTQITSDRAWFSARPHRKYRARDLTYSYSDLERLRQAKVRNDIPSDYLFPLLVVENRKSHLKYNLIFSESRKEIKRLKRRGWFNDSLKQSYKTESVESELQALFSSSVFVLRG